MCDGVRRRRWPTARNLTRDWAVKGFRTIALLESDGQTRCVAVRALAQTNDPRAIETFLKLLNYQKHPATEVRPPDALCRWDAAGALADKSGGAFPDEHRSETEQTFVDLLRTDRDRNVRIEAARGLRNFSSPDVVRGLIAGLRDEDFAVVHECEMSLAFLTGVTFDCDAYAWEQWYHQNEGALFVQGGQLPESRKPPYEGNWGPPVVQHQAVLPLDVSGQEREVTRAGGVWGQKLRRGGSGASAGC